MLFFLGFVLMAQAASGIHQDPEAVIRPRLSPCPSHCSVILTPSGTDDSAVIQAALDNAGNVTVCLSAAPGETFLLSSPVVVRSGKRLSGYRNRVSLSLPPYQSPSNPGFSTAIIVPDGASSASISCLDIDGGYPETCIPSTHPSEGHPSYNALVLVGSNVTNSEVRYNVLRNPAGWTALQWTFGGSGNQISSNAVLGAGFNWSSGGVRFEADGISAWGDYIAIENNVVIDATDQMIVAWGYAPRISGNRVYSRDRYAYGAFAFNDIPSYSGIEVTGNQVFVEGGTVGVAFSFGSALWQCGHCFLSDFANATVSQNKVVFSSGALGYAFVVNGAKNLVIDDTNTVDFSMPFSTPGPGCGVAQKWVGGKFLYGAQMGSTSACGSTLNLGCQNCLLQGGPWTAVNEQQGRQLIGSYPRTVPPPCGY